MKKLWIAAVAAIFAVMLAAPVYAADNLELSGSYRFEAWSVDDFRFADGADRDNFNQRMRVNAKINVADDAYGVIRVDLGEGDWGDTYRGGVTRPDTTVPAEGGDIENVIDFDRLYMHIDKGIWSATIGQQYVGLGILEVLDANPAAINFGIHPGPVDLSLIYGKLDEHGDVDDSTMGDTDLYAVNAGFQMAQFDSNVFFAMINDDLSESEANTLNNDTATLGEDATLGTDIDILDETNDVTKYQDEPWAMGFHTQGTVGMANLVGELAVFGGDYKDLAGDTIDYKGTQMYLKADADVTDMVNVGGEILWAKGNDDDDEAQISYLVDWWSFSPMGNNTPGTGEFGAFTDPAEFYIAPFDTANVAGGSGGGVEGITVFADIAPMEKLGFGTKIGYFNTQEDDATDVEDIFSYNVWAAYDIATNTTASLTYLATDADFDSSYTGDDETEHLVYAKIQLNF